MSERITVTIPDDLYQRLQSVKDALNVSRVCQEAIELVVRIEEIRRKDIPDMQKLVERLRIEKEQLSEEWKEIGITDGKQDALELSLPDFKYLEANNSINPELLEWIQTKNIQYLDGEPDEDAYLEGWRQGVLAVWEEAKENI